MFSKTTFRVSSKIALTFIKVRKDTHKSCKLFIIVSFYFFSCAEKFERQIHEQTMSERVKSVLQSKLSNEIDLYEFACKRLEIQFATVNKVKLKV